MLQPQFYLHFVNLFFSFWFVMNLESLPSIFQALKSEDRSIREPAENLILQIAHTNALTSLLCSFLEQEHDPKFDTICLICLIKNLRPNNRMDLNNIRKNWKLPEFFPVVEKLKRLLSNYVMSSSAETRNQAAFLYSLVYSIEIDWYPGIKEIENSLLQKDLYPLGHLYLLRIIEEIFNVINLEELINSISGPIFVNIFHISANIISTPLENAQNYEPLINLRIVASNVMTTMILKSKKLKINALLQQLTQSNTIRYIFSNLPNAFVIPSPRLFYNLHNIMTCYIKCCDFFYKDDNNDLMLLLISYIRNSLNLPDPNYLRSTLIFIYNIAKYEAQFNKENSPILISTYIIQEFLPTIYNMLIPSNNENIENSELKEINSNAFRALVYLNCVSPETIFDFIKEKIMDDIHNSNWRLNYRGLMGISSFCQENICVPMKPLNSFIAFLNEAIPMIFTFFNHNVNKLVEAAFHSFAKIIEHNRSLLISNSIEENFLKIESIITHLNTYILKTENPHPLIANQIFRIIENISENYVGQSSFSNPIIIEKYQVYPRFLSLIEKLYEKVFPNIVQETHQYYYHAKYLLLSTVFGGQACGYNYSLLNAHLQDCIEKIEKGFTYSNSIPFSTIFIRSHLYLLEKLIILIVHIKSNLTKNEEDKFFDLLFHTYNLMKVILSTHNIHLYADCLMVLIAIQKKAPDFISSLDDGLKTLLNFTKESLQSGSPEIMNSGLFLLRQIFKNSPSQLTPYIEEIWKSLEDQSGYYFNIRGPFLKTLPYYILALSSCLENFSPKLNEDNFKNLKGRILLLCTIFDSNLSLIQETDDNQSITLFVDMLTALSKLIKTLVRYTKGGRKFQDSPIIFQKDMLIRLWNLVDIIKSHKLIDAQIVFPIKSTFTILCSYVYRDNNSIFNKRKNLDLLKFWVCEFKGSRSYPELSGEIEKLIIDMGNT